MPKKGKYNSTWELSINWMGGPLFVEDISMVHSLFSAHRNKDKDVFPIHYMEPESISHNFVMHKPKTVWQKRKEKMAEAWVLFKESRVGLIGIGILIIFMMMALISRVIP